MIAARWLFLVVAWVLLAVLWVLEAGTLAYTIVAYFCALSCGTALGIGLARGGAR